MSTISGDKETAGPYSVLDYLLLDDAYDYGELDDALLARLNVTVIKTPLITEKPHKYDEHLVARALLSFV
ncbi:hypothetical protein N5P32_07235 [Marinomonas pontica]|nr:hypothetical protein [Marinomonas pontica]MCW8355691.1 hypothetical protein [Marinomonas pontica]